MSLKNSILSSEFYNTTINESYINIFNKYNSIIIDYLKHCKDNIYIQNNNYQKYIIRQGILTINHVFKLLLIYTKNIELTYFNCQKAYVYFIEFIDQISEDNHSFLQLNSKDASLFVYKKTIFDINNETTTNYISNNEIKKILLILDPLISIYNITLIKLINEFDFDKIIKITNVDFQKTMQKIIKYYIQFDNIEFLNKILEFVIHNNTNLLENLENFIKIFKKKDIDFKNIQLEIIKCSEK